MRQPIKRGQTTTEYLFLIVGIIIFVVLIYTLLKGNVVAPQQNRTSDDMAKWLKNTEALIFFDNFDSGTSEQWAVVTGNWLVENKEYAQKSAIDSEMASYAGKNSWVNYYAETKMLFKTIPISSGILGGISGRVNKNSGARYTCAYVYDAGSHEGRIVLYRFFDWASVPTQLGISSGPAAFDSNFHTIATQLNGNIVKCFFDDYEQLAYNDSTPFKYGQLSLESRQIETHFDSVRAKYQDGPNPIGPNPTPNSAIPTPTPTPTPTPSPTPNPLPGCSDGTPSNKCKIGSPPVYCNGYGELEFNCGICGCADMTDICSEVLGTCEPEIGLRLDITVLNTSISPYSERINWTTSQTANYTLFYGPTILYGQNASLWKKMLSHSLTLTDLLPDTAYHYYIRSCTALFCSDSPDYSFEIPIRVLIENVTNSSITYSSARVSWDTDVYSNSSVEYGETSAYGLGKNSSDYLLFHLLPLNNLKNFTTYHYRVSSCNATLCNSSSDYTFMTLQRQFCSETDGGLAPNITGATTNTTGTVNDICTNSTRLMEYYCSSTDGQVTYAFANCQACDSGACTGAFCADIDRTVVTNTGTYFDICNFNGAYDYYCNGNYMNFTYYPGACYHYVS